MGLCCPPNHKLSPLFGFGPSWQSEPFWFWGTTQGKAGLDRPGQTAQGLPHRSQFVPKWVTLRQFRGKGGSLGSL